MSWWSTYAIRTSEASRRVRIGKRGAKPGSIARRLNGELGTGNAEHYEGFHSDASCDHVAGRLSRGADDEHDRRPSHGSKWRRAAGRDGDGARSWDAVHAHDDDRRRRTLHSRLAAGGC